MYDCIIKLLTYDGFVSYFGGGGSSGALDYPDFQEDIQVNWITGGTTGTPAPSLTTPIEDAMNTALGATGNPYEGETGHNPIAQLIQNQDRFETADGVVGSISPEGDWKRFADIASEKLDEIFILETEITNEVNNFEENIRSRRNREISQWAGGMADINAVESTQFIIGMALRQGQVTSEVNAFESRLRLQNKRAKLVTIMQAINDMIRIMLFRADAGKSMTQLQTEINRINIIAQKERDREQLEIDALQATWDFEIYQYGFSALGALGGGGAPGLKGLSKGESALAGAASGAAIGAGFGPVGAGIGAGVGAVAGFLTGG